MYIIVKQLSNERPTKNRQRANCQNDFVKAVMTPKMNPTRLVKTRAGTRPKRSATQPNTKPPTMAPQKKKAWAQVDRVSWVHTQFSCGVRDRDHNY